ncbi:hypothetical protein [Thalassospira lucentensis]|uniref:hypothetical protein n=1 Tax=Thalassospira lucentensis TaxID=168935 RepID=UPI002942300F|nr:hypothetical protein [Thalassospira lucentensis]WOI08999.1 hypothetical protein R1T41_00800 [Thalassospira lucentensis]
MAIPDLRASARLRILRRMRFRSLEAFRTHLSAEHDFHVSRQLLAKMESGLVRMTIGHAHTLGTALNGDAAVLVRDDFSSQQFWDERVAKTVEDEK